MCRRSSPDNKANLSVRTSSPTLAALLTLSSLPRLWTNTEAGFDSWRIAEYIVSPEGRVSNGSSSVQLRTALFSAPMTAFVAGAVW